MSGGLAEHPGEEHRRPEARRAGSSAESGPAAAGRPERSRLRSYKRSRRPAAPPAGTGRSRGRRRLARRLPSYGPSRLIAAPRPGTVADAAPGPRACAFAVIADPEAPARRSRAAIAAVAVGILLVTAFGGGDHPRSRSPPLRAPRGCFRPGRPSSRPSRSSARSRSSCPVNQSRITAIGYHAAADGALELTPLGTQANQGLAEARRARHLRRRLGLAALVPASGRPGHRRPRLSTSAPRPAPTSTHRSPGRSSGSRR